MPAEQPRRADAQRNIERIVDAGLRLYGSRSGVSVADVAKEAGVGRVTLYAHFPSRTALAEAVVERAIADTVTRLSAEDFASLPPEQAFVRLVRGQWHILARNANLRANLLPDVDPEWLRRRHDPIIDQVRSVLRRGRDRGDFRTDLPADWIIAAVFGLVHAATDELGAGRLDEGDALDVLTETLLSILRVRRP